MVHIKVLLCKSIAKSRPGRAAWTKRGACGRMGQALLYQWRLATPL